MTVCSYIKVLFNFSVFKKRYLLTDTFFIAQNKVAIAFFVTGLLFPAYSWSSDCDLTTEQLKNSQIAKVKKVIDGDTLRLSTGKLVRFIGINTPEIDHKFGHSQPFAEKAKDYLENRVTDLNSEILLLLGAEKKDRHSRILAHIFTPGGENIQAEMLKSGYGVWIVVPPNLGYMDCYRRNEQQARNLKKGVWGEQYKAPRDTRSLTDDDRGFQWIQGKISRIGKGQKNWWLNFEDERFAGKFSKVTLRVNQDDLHYFDKQMLENLSGKVVRVKGWLSLRRQQLVMYLRHPESIEVVD